MGEATQSWFKKVVSGAADFIPSYLKRDADQAAHAFERGWGIHKKVRAASDAITEADLAGKGTKMLNAKYMAWDMANTVVGHKAANALSYLGGDGNWMRGVGRSATVAGAVGAAGLAVGVPYRYATGGTMTQNGDGERDIVGLPI